MVLLNRLNLCSFHCPLLGSCVIWVSRLYFINIWSCVSFFHLFYSSVFLCFRFLSCFRSPCSLYTLYSLLLPSLPSSFSVLLLLFLWKPWHPSEVVLSKIQKAIVKDWTIHTQNLRKVIDFSQYHLNTCSIHHLGGSGGAPMKSCFGVDFVLRLAKELVLLETRTFFASGKIQNPRVKNGACDSQYYI